MPPDEQRRASLDQQLAEAPLLDEHGHAVKGERGAEHVQDGFAGKRVGVVDGVESGEGEQRRGEGDGAAAGDSRDGEIGEQRRAAEHEQREKPRGEQLGGEVVPERHGRQLDEGEAADGKAAVEFVLEAAVFVPPDAVD